MSAVILPVKFVLAFIKYILMQSQLSFMIFYRGVTRLSSDWVMKKRDESDKICIIETRVKITHCNTFLFKPGNKFPIIEIHNQPTTKSAFLKSFT